MTSTNHDSAIRDGRPLLRLLHTADVHIGDEVDAASRLRGLRGFVDAALRLEVDALIIAGDLFDNARVRPPEINEAFDQLARVSMPVFLTPGNHDCLGPPSIYDRVRPADLGGHVHFFDDPEGSHAVREDLGLTVWSRAMVEHTETNQPLLGHTSKVETHWQVALAHGFFFPASQRPDRSSPLPEKEIAGLRCDYLALGHWHRFYDVSSNGTAASYPGSPSEAGGSYASVNLVVLDPAAGVRIERVPL